MLAYKELSLKYSPEDIDYDGRHNCINGYLAGLHNALSTINTGEVDQVVSLILETTLNDRTIFICGNGGSASTASHMACDLAKGCRTNDFPPVRAIALTDSLPQLTAWSNDTNYENCFSGQLETLGRPGDLLIAISGSGNSPNVLKAVRVARQMEMKTVGFAGFSGGLLKGLVDDCLVIPAENIEQVEDVHLVLQHTIAVTLRCAIKDLVAPLKSV